MKTVQRRKSLICAKCNICLIPYEDPGNLW